MAQETYDWSTHYSDEESGGTTTFTSSTGETVDVTISQPDPNGDYRNNREGFETNTQGGNSGGHFEAGPNFDSNSDTLTTTISFDSNTESGGDSVTDVSFTIFDIDSTSSGTFQDQVTVLAFDEFGNPLTVTLTAVNSSNVSISGNTATAILGSGSGPQGSVSSTSSDGNVQVFIEGEVATIQIIYGNGPQANSNPSNQVVGFGDLSFDLVPTVICFVRGTHIQTDRGEVPVENLVPGDMVQTADNGLQPLRWIGSRKVAATGALAPVRFEAGAIGNTRPLSLSPQHRVMLSGWKAELYAGTEEVLVPAISMLNDHNILRQQGGEVEYFHLMFDRHEIIFAEGVATESLFVTRTSVAAMPAATRQEFQTLFPDLCARPETAGDTARPVMKAYEASVLL